MRFTTAFPLLVFVISCSSATGNPSGGDQRFDAAVPPVPVVDSGPGNPDGGPADITWTGLYRDFFGAAPPGPGCSGSAGSCHGATGDPGAGASNFVCGKSKDDCFTGITNKAAGLVDPSNAPGSGLITVIRHQQNGVQVGSMPQSPTTYVFSADAVKRIEDWMTAGAKND
jgi:hypothetical protein